MKDLEKRLCNAKCLLDEPFKNKLYGKTTYLFESFNCEKDKIVSLSNNFNITNAWMKAHELIDHFDLIPKGKKDEAFVHFDNASFPGSFILAAHHHCTSYNTKYKWFASSLANDTAEVKDHLEDKYDLRKNYHDNWLMSETNDGDVTNPENLLDFQKKMPLVDLYTSDLGFDVSQDYNAQEKLHLTAHYGQMLSGLMVLKPGGNFVAKQFTFFQEANLCNIAILTQFFEEVYIAKPTTSKTDNSEIYLVGKNFSISSPDIIPKMLIVLGEAFRNKTQPQSLYGFDKDFASKVAKAAEVLTQTQIDKIVLNVDLFNSLLKEVKTKKANPYLLARDMFKNVRAKELRKWYAKYKIKKIATSQRLKMKDTFRQLKHSKYRKPR